MAGNAVKHFDLRGEKGKTQKCFLFLCVASQHVRACFLTDSRKSSQSKTSFLSPPLNIHQRMKLEVCCMRACVCLAGAHSTSGRSHLRGRGILPCVCARIQTAPTGINYLEKSLFYLSTVRRAQAHKVLLPVSQEARLVHHPAWRTVPTSQPRHVSQQKVLHHTLWKTRQSLIIGNKENLTIMWN